MHAKRVFLQIIADVKLPKSESSTAVEPDSLSQAASRAHKLAVAARLVAEMEATLAQFSDQVSGSCLNISLLHSLVSSFPFWGCILNMLIRR